VRPQTALDAKGLFALGTLVGFLSSVGSQVSSQSGAGSEGLGALGALKRTFSGVTAVAPLAGLSDLVGILRILQTSTANGRGKRISWLGLDPSAF